MKLTIDGTEYEVNNYYHNNKVVLVTLDNGQDYYVAESSETAGEAARDYYEDLATNDSKEFVCLVGEGTLVEWALGNYAGPGYTLVRSLDEWLDLWLEVPEEHYASYDGTECAVTNPDEDLIDELGFTPTVAYRNN